MVGESSLSVMLVNMSLNSVRGGGTAERTRQLARHLSRSGHSCTIITLDHDFGKTGSWLEEHGIDLIAFRALNNRFHLPIIHPLVLWQAVKKVDIVHLMNHWTLINALVFFVATLLKKPIVICPAGALRIMGRSKKLKAIYSMIIGDRMIRNATGIIIIAENERDHFSSHAPAKSIQLIPNGIDPSDFIDTNSSAFRKRFALPAKNPIILFMGRLNFIKGPDILLKSFISILNQIDDYHLVFAGPDDGMLPELQKICRSENLFDKVHFVGYVGGALKSQAYHAASFLVIPSRQEAMSIVALEAGATGTPVLLTDTCGFDEVGAVGGGIVVKADIDDLAAGILRMAALADRHTTMGEAMRTFVQSNFSWPIILKKHLEYFQEMTD